MELRAFLSAIGAIAVALLAAAGGAYAQVVPPGGDAALACGQNPDGRAYWVEYAFCDIAVRGPGRAKGLAFWSHGVSGNNEQFRDKVPPLMRRLAQQGWDVVRINRNNLYERCTAGTGQIGKCWEGGGVRHVADLVERARQAQAQGYAKVIAAGQSFGGAISVEANAKAPGLFHAIVALSPGHGSDALGTSGASHYTTLDKQLLNAVAGQKSGRLVILIPWNDAYHPNRDASPITAQLRQTLTATGLPFVQFDETLAIGGHGVGMTSEFDSLFGACIAAFLDPARSVAGGETNCQRPGSGREK